MRRIIGLALTLVTTTSPLFAQRSGRPSGLREVRDGGSAGLTVVVAQPLGDFSRTGDVAAGLTGFVVVGLDRSASVGLRIDGSYLVYDSYYRSNGISTASSIGSLAIGPQITLGRGPIRPYGFATLGGALFWSSVSNNDSYCGCYDSDVFYVNGRFTTVTQVGTGLMIAVSRRRSVALDLGVRDVRHERVRYVPAGGITENSDGSFSVERVETPVRMRVFQIGVSVGIR